MTTPTRRLRELLGPYSCESGTRNAWITTDFMTYVDTFLAQGTEAFRRFCPDLVRRDEYEAMKAERDEWKALAERYDNELDEMSERL